MVKCEACNQQVLSRGNLCYTHEKYRLGIKIPYYQSLYDFVFAQETLHKDWKHGKLGFNLSEKVENKVGNERHVEYIRHTILTSINLGLKDLSTYRPLLTSLANKFSNDTLFSFDQLYNQGWLELMKLQRKIKPNKTPKQISRWVFISLRGSLLNYVNRNKEKLAYSDGIDVEELLSDDLEIHDKLKLKQKQWKFEEFICESRDHMSTRCQKVVDLMLEDELTQQEMAEEVGVSVPTIRKEINNITLKLLQQWGIDGV